MFAGTSAANIAVPAPIHGTAVFIPRLRSEVWIASQTWPSTRTTLSAGRISPAYGREAAADLLDRAAGAHSRPIAREQDIPSPLPQARDSCHLGRLGPRGAGVAISCWTQWLTNVKGFRVRRVALPSRRRW